MSLFSASEFLTKALAAFKRFPFTLLWVMVSTLIIVIIAERDIELLFKENYLNLMLTSILGVSWLIGVQFYIEQFKRKGLWWIKVVILLLLIAFYFTLPDHGVTAYNQNYTPYMRWFLYLIVGHLSLLFAPFITVWHPKAYWNYLGTMLIAIARSALFSGVFYLGLVLAMLAVQYLFNIEVKDERYFQLFVICLGVINTWVYLSYFPKDIQLHLHIHFHKAIEVFVTFILIPLAALYIIILYAYAITICVQWELPKGWVSYLIIALAFLLLLIQCIIHPIRLTHESRVLKGFQPLAYWLLLPLLVLLYVAIYKRVTDYGITEARYFLILIAVFITGATLYLIFSRKQQLRYLPFALAIIGLLSSFGFWGAFAVSTRSQLGEFKEVYSAFAKAEKETIIAPEAYKRFSSITRYLIKKNGFKELETVLGYDPSVAFPDTPNWKMTSKIIDSLGLKGNEVDIEEKTRYLSYKSENTLPLNDYNWGAQFRFNRNDNNTYIEEGYSIKLSASGTEILVERENETVLTIAAKTLIAQLPASQRTITTYEVEKMVLSGTTADFDIILYFSNLNLQADTGVLVINYASGIVLLNTNK